MGTRRGLSRSGGERFGQDSSRGLAVEEEKEKEKEGPDDGRSVEGRPETGSSPPKSRRRRPWLRVLFALFLIVEALVLYLVNEYSPVFEFEITSVTVTGEDGVTTVRVCVRWSVSRGFGVTYVDARGTG